MKKKFAEKKLANVKKICGIQAVTQVDGNECMDCEENDFWMCAV